MMSLFSSFDCFFFPFSKLILMIFFVFCFKKNFLNFCNSMMNSSKLLESFFYSLNPGNMKKFSILLFLSLFFLILSLNFLSVFPFIFPLTSSFGMIISSSLILWGSLILFQLFQNFKGLVSHFIPEGCPLGLAPLLFLIEGVSSMIRPLTLSVRLTANILAGHLLMILLSKLVFLFIPAMILYTSLNFIELLVALIQSYIFVTMVSLYYSEIH